MGSMSLSDALSLLEEAHTPVDRSGAVVSALALSPSEARLASGDVLRVTSDEVRIAVGWIEAVFDHHGALLDTHACDPPAKASIAGAYVEVRGFESNAIDVTVTALGRGEALDEPGPAVGPALVVTRDDAVLDVVTLDAHALAFAWVDAQTMVVLDAGGHVSFWRRGSARGPRSRSSSHAQLAQTARSGR